MSGPEIDIEAVTYSAVGSVNSKKFSNVLPAPGVLVLGNETLSASPPEVKRTARGRTLTLGSPGLSKSWRRLRARTRLLQRLYADVRRAKAR
jgi:hypothetical protein